MNVVERQDHSIDQVPRPSDSGIHPCRTVFDEFDMLMMLAICSVNDGK